MEKGSEVCKRKHHSSLNHICNYFQSIYILEHTSLDCAENQFTLRNSVHFYLIIFKNQFQLLSHLLEPNFPTHSLQIHCIGLIRFKSNHTLGQRFKTHSYKLYLIKSMLSSCSASCKIIFHKHFLHYINF